MILAKESYKMWYCIKIYFIDGEEREFNFIDWCKLDRKSNTLIIDCDGEREYIRYTEVRQIHIKPGRLVV
jgi:hypothetical protein